MKNTKKVLTTLMGVVLLITLIPLIGYAAVPQQIAYQGQLTDQYGDPVLDGDYDMSFALYDVPTGGTALWSEAQTVAVTDGIYNVILGQPGNELDPDDFVGALYLGVQVGTDLEMTPRQPVTSVGYALRAAVAESVKEGAVTEIMIVDGAVTTAKVADNAITEQKLGDATVTTVKIQDGATLSEISDDDGAGSGLDADLFDGYDSSAFMPAGADEWVDETGDTMTGQLAIIVASGNGLQSTISSSYGSGVYGIATVSSGDARGVYGQSNSTEGRGVSGYASAATGTTYAVYGRNASTSGHGVYGWASATSGTNYGVYGRSDSPSGWDFYAANKNYGPFTGAHEAKLSENFPQEVEPGLIVAVTGEAQIRENADASINLHSTLPTVKLADRANDKAVFGVLVAEVSLPENHWYEDKEGERFASVNALGEGRVWVTDTNGVLEVGDYITTSSIPGYGQRQDDDLLHSYTLGKAIETVNWDKVTETVKFNGKTYKVYLIAVIYTSG